MSANAPSEEKKHVGKSAATVTQPSPLSPRERQLLSALAEGSTRAELAVEWGISVGTIHNHIRVIHAKLAARTTEQALASALRQGWL
jgi:two-component system response regulator DesR